ncbi:hypothetical protein MRB53_003044 [Persea americana]|uniref:Uncharacterized protein n=1 Tax=Persea americana TaxID=3435 RepID=A0ACC2MW71_PERAE|nr:hypothetical protein MRB53_003044 [Persea americana]
MDQQQSFKHFCRICKKGFMCGRALGGHMRAHGIGDETGHFDDDDSGNDWIDNLGGKASAGNKRMYALRANPNRLKGCRSCENCGQEFSSWKSFFEHGKCSSSDDGEMIVSSPEEDIDGVGWGGCGGWSKRKRTRRVPSSEEEEEEDLANCLVMLSTARVDPPAVDTDESSATAGKEEEERREFMTTISDKAKGIRKGLFECKACKKVFNSHQALGGHRASHKKVKGCFASKPDNLDESIVEEEVITHEDLSIPSKIPHVPQMDFHVSINPSKTKSKVHECSICHRTFASGQALGGHKRCHWVTSNSSAQQLLQRPKSNQLEALDLNLPAPVEDPSGARQDNLGSLHLQLPTAICIQQWIGMQSNANKNDSQKKINSNNNISSSSLHLGDEADSRIKIAKLSDLKDINLGGDSSPWLQVGIGSAANGTNDP